MENGPFIDGLPINSMVIFHGYVSHNQRVIFIYVLYNNQFRHGRPGYLVDHTWDTLERCSKALTLAQGFDDFSFVPMDRHLHKAPSTSGERSERFLNVVPVFRMLHRVHIIFIPVI